MIILPLRPDASWRHPPVGTVTVMLTLLLVHILWGRGDPAALEPYLLDFRSFNPVQWLTSGLLHADWLHLIGNLVFLFVFGAIVEDFLGHRFLPVYLLLTVATGALEQCLFLVGGQEGKALGASSAIYGLLALAVLWAPRTQVSTFVWLILHRPLMVRIRVGWLAGGYIMLEVLSVWLQGGRPSSEFLHACGIAVGLPFGLLCLRQRWVDTAGGDLLGSGRPASVAAAVAVPWDDQAGRLAQAVVAGDLRVALAAYDVLRREHPARMPDLDVVERLAALCEERLDFHRAVAVGERTLAAGAVSDGLHLRLARILGQHLGDIVAGVAHLDEVRPANLDTAAQAEYARLRERLQRKRQTQRYVRGAQLPLAAIGFALALSMVPLSDGVQAAEADPWAAPPAVDPWANPPAADPFAEEAGMPAAAPALPLVEVEPTVGRIAVGDGAVIDLPDDLLYLPWAEASRFFGAAVAEVWDEPPLGLILGEEAFDRLIGERETCASYDEWDVAVARFLLQDNPIQVAWEEGWVDTREGLPGHDDLMADMQMHARLMSRRRALGPGLSITVDGWGMTPTFVPARGSLVWSIFTSIQAQGPMPGLSMEVSHLCMLGASGTLRLLCEAMPNQAEVGPRLTELAAAVSWESDRGFSAKQLRGVGERTGGIRRLMLPRLVFGNLDDDRLVYREGLGVAWILLAIPAAVVILLVMRWIRHAARPPAVAPAAAVVQAGPRRCPACGSAVDATASRCLACGSSLVARH